MNSEMKQNTQMIAQQLRANAIVNERVLEVMSSLAREQFLPVTVSDLAYADERLPIGHNQTMLMPMEQAKLLQALNIQTTDSICEIGTGTGYLTAALAMLGEKVVSFELFADFSAQAEQQLNALNLHNVQFRNDDANNYFSTGNTYDVICATACFQTYPEQVKHQLKTNGRFCFFFGDTMHQKAMLITRLGKEAWQEIVLFETSKVPALLNMASNQSFVF